MHNQEAFAGGKAGAIIVAAGSGLRLGGAIPKQFLTLGGKPMLLWSVEAMLRCNKIATIIVVVSPGETNRVRALLPRAWNIHVVAGGATRTESVRAGLDALDPI
ncbi:MAG TPA: 2-C-methyl-D-erythritol 4-phosphate cytidylyltransferase, partial [Hyphomonadaceae bacterium]|nr:2-C-methyl-D-erythritol 4-phosphate cytidylyltransferase [Hyphomonadaceae bacterium]